MIKFNGITKNYGFKKVLKGIDFKISRGEIIGIFAPNGYGKSTLMRILVGTLQPSSGEYEFNGSKFTLEDKIQIGYVSDEFIIPPNWKVEYGVEYYIRFFSTFNKEKCYSIFEKFNIDRNCKVGSLSSGEKQKYQLALALSIEGSLYVFDEILSKVDIIDREEIINMILDNFNENSTIIMSSHLINDIDRMIDRVIMIKDGVVKKDIKAEVLREGGSSISELYKEVFKKC